MLHRRSALHVWAIHGTPLPGHLCGVPLHCSRAGYRPGVINDEWNLTTSALNTFTSRALDYLGFLGT